MEVRRGGMGIVGREKGRLEGDGIRQGEQGEQWQCSMGQRGAEEVLLVL